MVFSNRELPPTVISHLAFCNSSVRHLQVKTTSGQVKKTDEMPLRVVQIQAILFLKSSSERVGSDIERLFK